MPVIQALWVVVGVPGCYRFRGLLPPLEAILRALVYVVALTLSTTAADAQEIPTPDLATLRKTVEGSLFDYERSRFRDVFVVEYRNPKKQVSTYSVCGFFNAPNRMGGMVGWQMFSAPVDGTRFNAKGFTTHVACGARDAQSAQYWFPHGDDLSAKIAPGAASDP